MNKHYRFRFTLQPAEKIGDTIQPIANAKPYKIHYFEISHADELHAEIDQHRIQADSTCLGIIEYAGEGPAPLWFYQLQECHYYTFRI